MFCSKCGTQLPDDAMFCSECGAPTRNYRKQQQEPGYEQNFGRQPAYGQQPYPPYEQGTFEPEFHESGASVKAKFSGGSKRGVIMAAVIIAIAVLAGILYVQVLKPQTPQDTIDKLEKAIEDLDVEKIMACFDQETRQAYEDGMSEYGEMGDSLTGLLGMAGGLGIGPDVTIRVNDINYDGSDSCTVSINLSLSFMGESQEESMDIPMKKEGKDWVIDGAASGAVMGELF
ncbi:MAG: zinc ribbon domain-containing protein [Ruminococcus sp.]|jgi:hypothetical protein